MGTHRAIARGVLRFLSLTCLLLSASCSTHHVSQKLNGGVVAHLAATSTVSEVASAEPAPEPTRAERRRGKGRFGNAGVYVDGRFVGMLKHAELPPTLSTTWKVLEDGRAVRRYAFTEYLAALGVDVARVQALHLHGGRSRVGIISGSELRRVGAKLQFSFTRSDSGKPRVEYPDERLDTNTSVDKLAGLAVYLDKPAPRYDSGSRTLRLADGRPVAGMAYSKGERHGGTRVYLDGRFIGSVHRRSLSETLRDGEHSLASLIAEMGVEEQDVHHLQLVTRRGRVAVDDSAERLEALSFSLARHSRGRIRVAALDDNVEAIQLFHTTRPAQRERRARN